MAKKNQKNIDDIDATSSNENLVTSSDKSDPPEDVMSRVALLCQDQRWREALALCFESIKRAESEGREDAVAALNMASQKIEYSLRRQMAAAFIRNAQKLLHKEYLLDVSQ